MEIAQIVLPMPVNLPALVRPIDPGNPAEVDLVAERMRATLVEVLGQEGKALYSPQWLRERVLWHLRPDCCAGQVFLALSGRQQIIGHIIVRSEQESNGRLGLISTVYVIPAARRTGVAKALLDTGESWLLRAPVAQFATDTSETNVPLIRLFGCRGYRITFRSAEKHMVRLSRDAN